VAVRCARGGKVVSQAVGSGCEVRERRKSRLSGGRQGELIALLGVNGAGKTTTIKMLTCLIRPTRGDAAILGNRITASPQAVKEKISVSPQETAVARNLSVKENLELIAGIFGFDKKTAEAKVEEMLTAFRLHEVSGKKASTLSGGMQRRLGIAMALLSDPQILFLDEPTLDAGRAAIAGDYASILPHLWWVIGYAAVILAIAILVFRNKMKTEKH